MREDDGNAPPDSAQLAVEFDRALDELRQEHLTAVREQAVTCTSLPLDALLTVFNALDRASTSAELQTQFVQALAREFSRVILFTVHEQRLDAVEHFGFDFGGDVSKLSLPLATDSLLSTALRSGRLETAFPAMQNDASVRLPLGGTPACAVAIPFLAGDRVVVLIYADDSDAPEFAIEVPQTRAKFAEILYRHASLLFIKLETREKETSQLREFARRLVEKVERLHAADVSADKGPLERQQLLRELVTRSRQLWGDRLGRERPELAGLLDEQLQAAVSQADNVFTRDLALVTNGRDARPARGAVISMRR